ncbi:MAG: gamma-glutamyltransferase family protein, partial [Erysipelotrichaceae bacterium]|nr:gamma-glutamyltransferase family protein [Erysipelotrichaceae bacterium]
GPFGVMGGYMQPQGHVQTIMNRIDFGLNPQMALDAPRWQWRESNQVAFEPNFPKAITSSLQSRGHQVSVASNSTSFGRGQIIERLDNGVLVGGTESRTDSNIASY